MNQFEQSVREAAYKSLLKTCPDVIEALKKELKNGATAKGIEKHFVRKYGNGNLISNSTICAAYYIEAHPELLQSKP